MDSNKDDASRSLRCAKDAIASGDKERALKYIKIAKRLDPSLSTNDLLSACENLDEPQKTKKILYSEENVELVRNIKTNNDYYTILGLDKNCSVEEIRKAYRKLSLKVHPDKNKAPGSEDAFKKVSKAFTCLSDTNSRREYDQVGFVDEIRSSRPTRTSRRRYNNNHTRRNNHNSFFDDDFDPDEIFRAFFGGQQRDLYRGSNAYRTRHARNERREEEVNVAGGPSCLLFIQILPLFLLLLLAYIPFSEPDYSLQRNQSYQVLKTTQDMEISFYVRSLSAFEEKFPVGSSARGNLEVNVIKEYRNFLFQFCRIELQKRRWNKKMPTPRCNELHDRGFVDRQIPIR